MKFHRKILVLGVMIVFCMSMTIAAAPIYIDDDVKQKFENEITAYAVTRWECFFCGKHVVASNPPQARDCKKSPANGKHDWRVSK